MGRLHLARQPIFDRDLAVIGYELLFRDRPGDGARVGDDRATTNVVLGSFTELGLERVAGPVRAWINVSRDFLLAGLARTLPPDRVGLELLEGMAIDDALLEELTTLRAAGHRFALDDFRFGDGAEPLIPLADVVKLDVLALGPAGLRDHVRRLRGTGVALLAEKVETREEHATALSLGCDRFQGFFYRRPELLSGRRIAAERVAMLQLLAALSTPELELDRLAELIRRDVGLSVRLLRYINSAYLGLGHEVGSVAQAVTLLGPAALRRWATMSAIAGLDGTRSELTRTALIRARFCELAELPGDPGERFTLGLFSVIDALIGLSMEDALRQLPFPAEMHAALLDHHGPLGRLLDALDAVERGAFDAAEQRCAGALDTYLDALGWADDTVDALGEVDPVAA